MATRLLYQMEKKKREAMLLHVLLALLGLLQAASDHEDLNMTSVLLDELAEIKENRSIEGNESNWSDKSIFRLETAVDVGAAPLASQAELERRWRTAIADALREARARHLRQKSSGFLGGRADQLEEDDQRLRVQIIEQQLIDGHLKMTLIVDVDGQPVPAEVIGGDLALLSQSHISAVLHYPLIRLSAGSKQTEEQSRMWIIGAIFGGMIAILMCGWVLLVIYYNSCGRPMHPHSFTKQQETNAESQTENGNRGDADLRVPDVIASGESSQSPRSVKEALPTLEKEIEDEETGDLPRGVEVKRQSRSKKKRKQPGADEHRDEAVIDQCDPVQPVQQYDQQQPWHRYLAADQVASLFGADYPRPGPSTTTGVLQLRARDLDQNPLPML